MNQLIDMQDIREKYAKFGNDISMTKTLDALEVRIIFTYIWNFALPQ